MPPPQGCVLHLIIRAGTCCLLVEALHNFFVSQEFMILPTGAATFSEALQMGAEVYHNLKVACALPLLTVYALHRCW